MEGQKVSADDCRSWQQRNTVGKWSWWRNQLRWVHRHGKRIPKGTRRNSREIEQELDGRRTTNNLTTQDR